MNLNSLSVVITMIVLAFLVMFLGNGFIEKGEVLNDTDTHEEIHYHAGFQVYKDNELVDFTDSKYMNFRPCSEGEDHHDLSPEEEQIEKAHLHDNIGDVVHVHLDGAIWQDLFTNIDYELGEIEGYLNGERVENVLELPIEEYDSVVIFEGDNADIDGKIENRIEKEWIIEVGNMSESCGS